MIVFTFEHILNHISFSTIFILIILFFRTFLIIETTEIYNSIKKGMIMTFFCITTLLVTRWVFLNHFPISDLYESLIFLSWNFTSIYIVLYLKKKKNNFSTITALGTIFTQGFTTSGILTQTPKFIILIPALQSQWLMMHVSMIILGYAALLCGSLLSLTLLVIAFQKALTLTSLDKNNYLIKEYLSFTTFVNWNERRNILKNLPFFFYRNYCRFQLLQQLDRWSYRIISLGFVFLTIGIFSGAVWANEAWGSYWNWDPKETWAFITWILFTIYLHTYETTNLKLKSLNSAIVAFIGFFFIWICYFGVNIFGVGLHSYGSF